MSEVVRVLLAQSHRFSWTVTDFPWAPPDEVLASPWFWAYYINDVQFRIVLVPRGVVDPSFISLWLERKGQDQGPAKMKVTFQFGFLDRVGRKMGDYCKTAEFERNSKHGFETFMERDRVLKYGVHCGALTIFCDVYCAVETPSPNRFVEFEYNRDVEELVVEEKFLDNTESEQKLESKLLSSELVVRFRLESDGLTIVLCPSQPPELDIEVFAELIVAEKFFSGHIRSFLKEESLHFPDLQHSDLQEDFFKLKVTVMDKTPIIKTQETKFQKFMVRPSLHSAKLDKDVLIQAREGDPIPFSSILLIAISPVFYRTLKEDDWVHFGLMGRTDHPEERTTHLRVTRQPGYPTIIQFQSCPRSSLEQLLELAFANLSYSGNLVVKDIYHLAKDLEIQYVADLCLPELVRRTLPADEVLLMLQFASHLPDKEDKAIMKKICLDHAHKYMDEILTSEDWRLFLITERGLADEVLNHLNELEGEREIP